MGLNRKALSATVRVMSAVGGRHQQPGRHDHADSNSARTAFGDEAKSLGGRVGHRRRRRSRFRLDPHVRARHHAVGRDAPRPRRCRAGECGSSPSPRPRWAARSTFGLADSMVGAVVVRSMALANGSSASWYPPPAARTASGWRTGCAAATACGAHRIEGLGRQALEPARHRIALQCHQGTSQVPHGRLRGGMDEWPPSALAMMRRFTLPFSAVLMVAMGRSTPGNMPRNTNEPSSRLQASRTPRSARCAATRRGAGFAADFLVVAEAEVDRCAGAAHPARAAS
jgi:hypothetical protein